MKHQTAHHSMFRAIGEMTRWRILALLADRPRTPGELATFFEITRPAISQHLGILENAGLVTVTKHGRHSRYGLRARAFSLISAWSVELARAAMAKHRARSEVSTAVLDRAAAADNKTRAPGEA